MLETLTKGLGQVQGSFLKSKPAKCILLRIMIISYVLIRIVNENASVYFSIDNLRTIRPKVCIAFFFHSINQGIPWERSLYIVLFVSMATDYTTMACTEYMLSQGLWGKNKEGRERRKVKLGVGQINESIVLHTSSSKLFILGTRLIFTFQHQSASEMI